ncbi:TIGR00341 family protein [Microbacterium sp. C7(2022)]|uniref:TIGR00341 family protein n=1 Tax=Microbacterium sp. C7(2022) TaxID=2992759 RepID=UPI00237A436E|nr:TIGR00341 family protein [Microbacterium sp. C7(2022)]MDE0547061.1 TIGR00341 family protein [Microbacterium sp. C7(2022)]
MNVIARTLIPPSQRQPADALRDAVDLGRGDALGKRTGFLIMLVLSAVIAGAGVLGDSTATVIGAMIIAPLGTPILGIAVGLVTGRRGLVGRSFLWVMGSVVIVVLIGMLLSAYISDPAELDTNSQIVGRTSPQLLDLLAALATGTAGAFAMCRRDLSAVLPGVAISISLVPPLGVVGVCAGQGAWDDAFGAFLLFASNVVSLVIAGSVVFTIAGYAKEIGSSRTANRRRAYTVVAVLTLVITIPLAINTSVTVALAHWTNVIRDVTGEWLVDEPDAQVIGVTWSGVTATVEVTTSDGDIPSIDSLRTALDDEVPAYVNVTIEVAPAVSYPVIR